MYSPPPPASQQVQSQGQQILSHPQQSPQHLPAPQTSPHLNHPGGQHPQQQQNAYPPYTSPYRSPSHLDMNNPMVKKQVCLVLLKF